MQFAPAGYGVVPHTYRSQTEYPDRHQLQAFGPSGSTYYSEDIMSDTVTNLEIAIKLYTEFGKRNIPA